MHNTHLVKKTKKSVALGADLPANGRAQDNPVLRA
jgi:hypothetical protein